MKPSLRNADFQSAVSPTCSRHATQQTQNLPKGSPSPWGEGRVRETAISKNPQPSDHTQTFSNFFLLTYIAPQCMYSPGLILCSRKNSSLLPPNRSFSHCFQKLRAMDTRLSRRSNGCLAIKS